METTDSFLPPSYSGTPPHYAGISIPTTEHEYTFNRPSGNKINLKLYSFAARSTYTPFYWSGSTLSGLVSLDISPSSSEMPGFLKEGAHGVYFTFRGYRVTGRQKAPSGENGYQRPFLEKKIQLYPEETPISESSTSKKLESGSFTWPFSITLPETFEAENRKGMKFPLPPTFNRIGLAETLNYEIHVVIQRGHWRTDEVMIERIVLLPRSLPSKLPSLRIISAIRDRLPLPLPSQDPDGWQVKEATIKAKVLGVWETNVLLKFAIPTPVQYTSGQPIPFLISITINSINPIHGTSSSATLEPPSLAAIVAVTKSLRQSFAVSLEVLYVIGHDAGEEFSLDDPGDILDALDVKGSVLIYTITSTESIDAIVPSLNAQPESKTPSAILGVESWYKGRLVTETRTIPDFAVPTLRVSHTIALRTLAEADNSFVLEKDSIPSKVRKFYAHRGAVKGPPVIYNTVQIMTQSLPGAPLSDEPAPQYDNSWTDDRNPETRREFLAM